MASAFSDWATRAQAAWEFPLEKWRFTTALAGIPPEHCLPILLDVGTDNENPAQRPNLYRMEHKRVRGQEYDDFVEAFVSAVEKRWPHILLQWEDFAGVNAARLLERYRRPSLHIQRRHPGNPRPSPPQRCWLRFTRTGVPLREQTIAMFGSGAAGIGIVNLLITAMKEEGLSEEQAHKRIYAFNRYWAAGGRLPGNSSRARNAGA